MTRLMLAIDTSQGTGVALLRDGKVLAERYESDTMHHAERIGILMREVLDQANEENTSVATVAVGIGPAPFTGLRVGIAAAKMFAEGVRARLISVSSLDAIAYGLSIKQPTLVITDARRGEVYFALYDSKDPNLLPKRSKGPGVMKLAELEALLKSAGQDYLLIQGQASASGVGLLAHAQVKAAVETLGAQAEYLRAPDASPAKPKAVSG